MREPQWATVSGDVNPPFTLPAPSPWIASDDGLIKLRRDRVDGWRITEGNSGMSATLHASVNGEQFSMFRYVGKSCMLEASLKLAELTRE